MRLPLFAVLCVLTACGKADKPQEGSGGPPPAKVTAITVVEQPWIERIAAVGTVKARDSVVIAAKQAERISAVYFESGQRVAKGQLLVELDDGAVRAEWLEARANLADLETQVARLQSLQAQQLIARSQLDTVQASRNAARAKVQAAQERLNDRRIVAPFSGVLGLRQISKGQFVSAGTAMVNLDDLSRMWVDFPLPEKQLATLTTGMRLELVAEAYPDRVFDAQVTSIDSRVDVATRAILVRAEIAQASGLVRPGMLMRVSLQQTPVSALVLPELAVQQVGNRSFVFVAADDGTALSRDIRVAGRQGGLVAVEQGIRAGERVVLEGTSKLRDGQKISIVTGADSAP
jgi:membrane fusion protein (multidrug efflux system)